WRRSVTALMSIRSMLSPTADDYLLLKPWALMLMILLSPLLPRCLSVGPGAQEEMIDLWGRWDLEHKWFTCRKEKEGISRRPFYPN
ncbi:hypothetical protein TSMEX_008534, partial [Taenia solium]